MHLKKIVLLFVFTLGSNLLLAQKNKWSSDTIILIGKMILTEKDKYDYKIRFSINAQTNEITGLSLSDFGGPNETKAKIVGTYNPKKDEIFFRETEIVKSKVKLDAKEFCYISATLKFKRIKILQSYTGKFVGKKMGSQEECGKGEIQLLDVAKAKALLGKILEKNALVEKQKADAKEEKEIKKKLIIVEKGEVPDLKITGTKIKISIWDKGQIDGDKISVMLNNKTIVDNYVLDSTRKVLDVQLSNAATDTIKIIAHNEGAVPPNTAMLKIESATEMYPIEVRAELNEVKMIYLKKR